MGKTLSPLFTWRSAVVASKLRPTAKFVALALSLYMSERGDSCWPSIDTIAADTSQSRSTVSLALKTLIDEGWLSRRGGGGRGRSTTYTALVPETAQEESGIETARLSDKPLGKPSETAREPSATTTKTTPTDHDRPRASARERDPLFDALALACEFRLDAMTKEAARLCGIATAEIRRVGATPEMMRPAVANYRRRYQGAAATPKAIANHWAEIVPATNGTRQAACAECGVGGGRHLADCPLAGASDTPTRLAPRETADR